MLTVEQLDAGRLEEALAAIGAGFDEEQNFAHVFPNPRTRRKVMTLFVRTMMRESLRDGGTYVAVEDGEILGGVVALAPGRYPFPLGPMLRMVPDYLRMCLVGPHLTYRILRMYPAELRHHPRGQRYWYLFAIAFRPGARSLRAVQLVFAELIARIDRDRAGAYLETVRPALVSGTSRYFGFTVLREGVRLAEGGPPYWILWRPPSG